MAQEPATSMHTSDPSIVGPPVAVPNDGIAAFFGRQVRIWGDTITDGAYPPEIINPWALWGSNNAIKRKLANYSRFRGNLHVRVEVSSSTMNYGALLLSFQAGGWYLGIPPTSTNADYYYRLPHDILTLSGDTAAELTIPFRSTEPYLDIFENYLDPGAGAFNNFTDRVIIQSLALMRSATGSTPPDAKYAVFAWATEVELSVPAPVVGEGPEQPANKEVGIRWSGVASTIASVSGALAKAPFIAAPANAISNAASAAAGVLASFGYSRPIVVPNFQYVYNRYWGNPNYMIGEDNVINLGNDPKNALSGTLGDHVDPLTITSFTSRPTIGHIAEWDAADAPAFRIVSIPVTPYWFIGHHDYGDGTIQVIPSNIGFAASMFNYWRGSITYKLTLIASAFHKGKLRIWWSPHPDDAYNPTNVAPLAIVDLAKATELEVTIDYAHSRLWLNIPNDSQSAATSLSVNDYPLMTQQLTNGNDLYYNGYLNVSVEVPLIAPINSRPVNIIIESYSKDVTFAYPTATRYALAVCTGEGPEKLDAQLPDSQVALDLVKTSEFQPTAVSMGENIVSFRPLLHRYEPMWFGGRTNLTYENGDDVKVGLLVPGYPYLRTTGLPTTDISNRDISTNTLQGLIGSCFVGWRGSMRFRFAPLAGFNQSRKTNTYEIHTAEPFTPLSGTNDLGIAFSNLMAFPKRLLFTGLAKALFQDMAGYGDLPAYQQPFYTSAMLLPTSPFSIASNYPSIATRVELLSYGEQGGDVVIPGTRYRIYCAMGDDIDLIGWRCPPILYMPKLYQPT